MNSVVRDLAGELPLVRNSWYVVAFSDEVVGKPMARRILGGRVVLYRTEAGQPVMLDDYCSHRAMALSQGKCVNGDRIQCPYHGMEFSPDGSCARVPSQNKIPRQMRVRSYPLVEKWKWIWAWMGDPVAADESLIPDHKQIGLEDPEEWWTIQRFVMNIQGNFQLLQENLLDLSHVSFLHEGSFDAGGMAAVSPTVEVDGDLITVGRQITEVMTGQFSKIFDLPEGTRMERRLVTRTWVPGFCVVSNYFRSLADSSAKVLTRHAPFAITPETETSCHYFVGMASNYGAAPTPQWLAASNKAVHDVFLTDQAAIESIQEAYGELSTELAPDTSVIADEAALRFRRILGVKARSEAAKA